MKNNNFEKWIDKFIKENNIDKSQTFEVTTNGKKHCFTIESVIDYIKIVSNEEQVAIQKMLERIVSNKGNIIDYFQCLSIAIISTTEDENMEENEETM